MDGPEEEQGVLGETSQVTVEVVAWVTRLVGGDGTRRKHFQEVVPQGATVRSVLAQFSSRFPQLGEALWDKGGRELAEHIEVLVNDAVLGVTHSLGSEMRDGDRITLVGAYIGGSLHTRIEPAITKRVRHAPTRCVPSLQPREPGRQVRSGEEP